MAEERVENQEYDFVIVGSGAGGGPLAANLALEGFSVVVIEAGGDQINDNYSVPAFHALATEDPTYSWEFFVKHYSDDKNPDRDEKYHKKEARLPGSPGIFYPRATGLGGCTTHHAMITVYPHESDWDNIAKIVGDDSWNAENMRKYFDRIERAQYHDGSVLLKLLQARRFIRNFLRRLTGSEHGEGARGARGAGWLSVNQADPTLLLNDIGGILKVVKAAFHTAKDHRLQPMPGLDPNNPSVAMNNLEGINVIPISVHNGKRTGARERVLGAQKILQSQAEQGEETGRLDIKTHTFATKVLFDGGDPPRAIGVKCFEGSDLYAARHHKLQERRPEREVQYMAKKEVILCGGAFNTPQLLMLSGIGPEQHLREIGIDFKENGIKKPLDLPGVGENLQDRYEVGVVAKAAKPFRLLDKATFEGRNNPKTDEAPDEVFQEWLDGGGIYRTNGAVLGIIMRSTTRGADDPPDLYIFGVPGYFRGYEIGYSEKIPGTKDHFTWAVLKGHTDNTSGQVTLKSNNPFDTPDIHFKYFEESDQPYEEDVQSVVDGVEFVLEIYDRLIEDGVIEEVVAPADRADRKALQKFVRDNAWGHHASCTCKIGREDDDMAVLDKDFQVRGAKNLRVVDASVFPRIPGLFILSSVYMISEKASDVIIAKYS